MKRGHFHGESSLRPGPTLLTKSPGNERSLWGPAEDKRPRRKNSHVSTSITPNPCLVHPLLRRGEGRGNVGERRRGEAKGWWGVEGWRSWWGGGKIKAAGRTVEGGRLRRGRRWETKGRKGLIKGERARLHSVCEIESEDGFKKGRTRKECTEEKKKAKRSSNGVATKHRGIKLKKGGMRRNRKC